MQADRSFADHGVPERVVGLAADQSVQMKVLTIEAESGHRK